MNTSAALAKLVVAGATTLAVTFASAPPVAASPFFTRLADVATTAVVTRAPQAGDVPASQSRGVALITVTSPSGEGAGTGMVLTPDGQVLTNYHVVQGSTAVTVTLADTGKTYEATVLGHDADADVALLQLAGASGLATITPDDDPLAVGAALTAVGNASGGGELVGGTGRVVALDATVTVAGNGGRETLMGVIQTNAGAVPGDSGGPMFDAESEVSGMTTAGGQTVTQSPGRVGRATTTVSYAVPIATALRVVDLIRAGDPTGSVHVGARAYLGVSVGSESLVVASVAPGAPATAAGLTEGSLITSVDGRAVTTHDELSAVLDALRPGQGVQMTWLDPNGASHAASVTLGESPVN